jgi:hypothetical protein
MKMELVLSSPSDCVVLQWLVAAGDAVAEGQVSARHQIGHHMFSSAMLSNCAAGARVFAAAGRDHE